jgi:ATP-dependent Lhr-like helicase
VEPAAPSPFARSVLFGFVGLFVYDGDAPLAERRMQALTLDSTLLAELLGSAELRELLDPEAIAQVAAEVGRLTPERHARGVDAVHDLLRDLGDLSTAEAVARGATPHDLVDLESARRAIRVRIAGVERWLAIEDAGRVRDALGTSLPVGVPLAFTEPVRDPLADLVARYARTHGPFRAHDVAHRLGVGASVARSSLDRLVASGRLVAGEFSPHQHYAGTATSEPGAGGDCPACTGGTQWCDADVLRRIRRRSLAALRREIEPVPPQTLGRFLPAWQGIGQSRARTSPGAVSRVLEQLAGVPMPASAVESLILPSRINGYTPGDLDALTAAGELTWAGAGALTGADGWVVFAPAEAAELLLPLPGELSLAPLHEQILDRLDGGQALFFRTIAEPLTHSDAEIAAALWELVWAGRLTNDTFAPVRALLASRARRAARPRPPARRSRYRAFAAPVRSREALSAPAPTTELGGRWSRLPEPDRDPTRRGYAAAEALLDRHGVVTRGAVSAERLSGGFAGVYPVLAAAEEAGRARRGYFIEGLGAAQFATAGAVERLRPMATGPLAGYSARDGSRALVLAATDPANPYGAALSWPAPNGAGSHQPGRKAGALVVLVDGGLALYVERGGRTLLSFTTDPGALPLAADALALAVRDGLLGKLAVEQADGAAVVNSPLGDALEAAGFRPTPRGLRLRA